MPVLKPEMNRVLDSYGNWVFDRFTSGINKRWKTGKNPIHLWLEHQQQGTKMKTRFNSDL
jgi:hypothetical protein